MTIDLEHTTVFTRNWEALHDDRWRFIINQGGSGSSKTTSIAQVVLLYCLTNANKRVFMVRKEASTLTDSGMDDFINLLIDLDLYDVERHNKSRNIYFFPNGSEILFFGTDKAQKLKGKKCHLLWCNEGDELWDEDFLQLNMRTSEKIIIDFNPSRDGGYIKDLLTRSNAILIKSTWRDNPFLEQTKVDELEFLKLTDPGMYTIYNLGEFSQSKEHVLTHWKTGTRPPHLDRFCYGLDFGWRHATTLIKVWHNGNGKEFFLEQIGWWKETDIDVIAAEMKAKGIGREDILADHARPDLISFLQRAGFQVRNADKEVDKGLYVLLTSLITVDENSKELIADFKNYRHKKVRGKITEGVVKEDDDGCDAARYACLWLRSRSQPMAARVR